MLTNEVAVNESTAGAGKKGIRNPFPMIGKVFKYEFISTVRIFGPLYIAMVLLGTVMGFFFLGNIKTDSFFEASSSVDGVEALFFTLYFLLVAASWIVTVIILEKRFKKSMLGDEAYLNMTLPVTVGEHLWGRAFVALVWIVICALAVLISGFMLSMAGWKEFFSFDWSDILLRIREETGYGLGTLIGLGCGMFFTFLIMAITYVYVVNAIGNLAKKGHTLVEVGVGVLLIFIYSQVCKYTGFNEGFMFENEGIARCLILMAGNLVFSVINIVATQLILTLKLNLE